MMINNLLNPKMLEVPTLPKADNQDYSVIDKAKKLPWIQESGYKWNSWPNRFVKDGYFRADTDAGEEGYFAVKSHRIVGYALYRWTALDKYDPAGSLSLKIKPSYQGRGIGSDLMTLAYMTYPICLEDQYYTDAGRAFTKKWAVANQVPLFTKDVVRHMLTAMTTAA